MLKTTHTTCTLLFAGAIAAAASTQPEPAFANDNGAAIALGIIGGIIAGAAAANANRPSQPYYPQQPAYAGNSAACQSWLAVLNDQRYDAATRAQAQRIVSDCGLPSSGSDTRSPPARAYAPSYQPTLLTPAPPNGPGAQFTQQGWRNGRLVVRIDGVIAPGDDARALAFANTIPVGTPVQVTLNSRGGSIIPTAKIAYLIRQTGSTTHVEGECVSACFLLYAAGVQRSYAPGARIGVHSINQDGADSAVARNYTTLMARAYADLGVPA